MHTPIQPNDQHQFQSLGTHGDGRNYGAELSYLEGTLQNVVIAEERNLNAVHEEMQNICTQGHANIMHSELSDKIENMRIVCHSYADEWGNSLTKQLKDHVSIEDFQSIVKDIQDNIKILEDAGRTRTNSPTSSHLVKEIGRIRDDMDRFRESTRVSIKEAFDQLRNQERENQMKAHLHRIRRRGKRFFIQKPLHMMH